MLQRHGLKTSSSEHYYKCINDHLARHVSSWSATQRFGGDGPRNFRELKTNITAYPTFFLHTCAFSQLQTHDESSDRFEKMAVGAFEPRNHLLSYLNSECPDQFRDLEHEDLGRRINPEGPAGHINFILNTALFYTGIDLCQAIEATRAARLTFYGAGG